MLVESQLAFLLHSRKYTDSKILVEFLTQSYGRVSAVVRQQRSKKQTGAILAFTPYLIDWRGKGQLKTVTSYEVAGQGFELPGKSLFCGFYLNEVLLRGLAVEDPNDALYSLYQQTVASISEVALENAGEPSLLNVRIEACLRSFELDLLQELGFGVNFDVDEGHAEISPRSENLYYLVNNERFVPVVGNAPVDILDCYSAAVLKNIANRVFDLDVTRRAAKKLCRELLKSVIGDRPLQSRELFK